ncbi:hypothetical protein Apa02nite_099780 [Actinoplanes palleronii]|uniref:Uncharacterized protein n=1 Tax=Actinoplanes palleronii TaxID=113570 RepID=A0ABQ4BUM3_9ACTN|nr:hypothetical protein Apa02nite_099780 [Actinoplanes palleronii]
MPKKSASGGGAAGEVTGSSAKATTFEARDGDQPRDDQEHTDERQHPTPRPGTCRVDPPVVTNPVP